MVDQGDRFTTSKGEVLVTTPKSDIVYYKVTGHLDKPIGDYMLRVIERIAAANRRVNIFCDWAEMTGYDSEVRASLTQWVATNRTRATMHLLVGSKLVAMGVSVANLALGGVLVGYTNRGSFDAALRKLKIGLSDI